MRTDMDVVKIFSLAVITAACGGPPKDRPLGPGYGKATAAQCTAAVDNYAMMLRDNMKSRHGDSGHGHVPERKSANFAEERAHRIELCQTEAAAEEAECVANARTLGGADECAPTWTW